MTFTDRDYQELLLVSWAEFEHPKSEKRIPYHACARCRDSLIVYDPDGWRCPTCHAPITSYIWTGIWKPQEG